MISPVGIRPPDLNSPSDAGASPNCGPCPPWPPPPSLLAPPKPLPLPHFDSVTPFIQLLALPSARRSFCPPQPPHSTRLDILTPDHLASSCFSHVAKSREPPTDTAPCHRPPIPAPQVLAMSLCQALGLRVLAVSVDCEYWMEQIGMKLPRELGSATQTMEPVALLRVAPPPPKREQQRHLLPVSVSWSHGCLTCRGSGIAWNDHCVSVGHVVGTQGFG